MATTIVTKSGSGAPTASDLVAGELAVDLTNKRLYTENSGGTVLELGTNPSGDITFGDSGKAIFGAGSDLQIYHDGTDSFLIDNGTGRLNIRSSSDFLVANTANSQNYIYAVESGAVNLYHSGSKKFETTATGIDVTGSVTADGLDVNSTTSGAVNIQVGNAAADIALGIGSPSTANKVVVTAGGDVGIGTSSPDHILCLEDAEPTLRIFDAANTLNQEQTIAFGTEPGDRTHAEIAGINTNTGNAAGALSFKTNAGSSVTEQMRIDASGQVQIGASAISSSQTSALLSVRKAGPSIEFGHNNAAGYGSTIGANASNGNPYVAFSAEPATTTLNAFRTRGLKGTVIAGGASGEITFNRVPLATADNQVPVESMRIDASGHAIIPAGVTLGTATGVYAAANTLDNYEEGLWTPVLTDGTTSYTLTVGHYTKVGRLVTVTCQYSSTLSTTATTGNAYITGLPVSNGVIRSVGAIHFRETVISYNTLTDGPILPIVNSSSSSVDLIAMGSASDYQKNIPLNELVNTGGGTSNYITFTATYQTT